MNHDVNFQRLRQLYLDSFVSGPGVIQAALHRALGKTFPLEVCEQLLERFIIHESSTMYLIDFQDMCNHMQVWLAIFRKYDSDQSGYIEDMELTAACLEMGMEFTLEEVQRLIAIADPKQDSKMSLDNFIIVCTENVREHHNL